MDQSASLGDRLPAADVLFHSRREKSRCIKCITLTATLNRSHSSKFIAYLEAPQHRKGGFQHMLKRKGMLPQNTTIVTPCPIKEGIFSLPDPTSFPAKILMLGSHRNPTTKPQETHRHTKEDSSRSQKPHQGISSATQPASQLTLISSKNPF